MSLSSCTSSTSPSCEPVTSHGTASASASESAPANGSVRDCSSESESERGRAFALKVRSASRVLSSQIPQVRTHILKVVATRLDEQRKEILAANAEDLRVAANCFPALSPALLARLSLDSKKLTSIIAGMAALAEMNDPIGAVLTKTQLDISESLSLSQVSVPIGVILVIFESRPDVLPQLVGLALRSGNGLILKGGSEAQHTLTTLHRIICSAISSACGSGGGGSSGVSASAGDLRGEDLICLVSSRSAVSSLLSLDDCIDLVIPRGSADLVLQIKRQSKIPVLAHADGICSVFIDSKAQLHKAIAILIDSKTDYPAACNSAEIALIHEQWLQPLTMARQHTPNESGPGTELTANDFAIFQKFGVSAQTGTGVELVLSALKASGVNIFVGPRAKQAAVLSSYPLRADLSYEYSDLAITIEIVSDVADAIQHIHKYGSAHTDCIVTEDDAAANIFLTRVDSACVFHNASTRFADGYRFGLGAEVGISTGRIHARGPVGVSGLLTSKWLLIHNDKQRCKVEKEKEEEKAKVAASEEKEKEKEKEKERESESGLGRQDTADCCAIVKPYSAGQKSFLHRRVHDGIGAIHPAFQSAANHSCANSKLPTTTALSQ